MVLRTQSGQMRTSAGRSPLLTSHRRGRPRSGHSGQLSSGAAVSGAHHGTILSFVSYPRDHRIAADKDCPPPLVPVGVWRSVTASASLGVSILEGRRATFAPPVCDPGHLLEVDVGGRSGTSSLSSGTRSTVHGDGCRSRIRCTGRSSSRRTHRPGGRCVGQFSSCIISSSEARRVLLSWSRFRSNSAFVASSPDRAALAPFSGSTAAAIGVAHQALPATVVSSSSKVTK